MRISYSCCACVVALTFTQPAPAVTTSWNSSVSGIFTTATNWTGGVPVVNDTAVFNRNLNVSYKVDFPSQPTLITRQIKQLRVGTNSVSFSDSVIPLELPANLSIDATGLLGANALIIGDTAGQVAVLNTTLNSFSTRGATIGNAAGSTGTLNVNGGTFNLTGPDGNYLGWQGPGTLNVSSGGVVNSAGNILLGFDTANSHGTLNVSGSGSTMTSPGLQVAGLGTGTLTVQNGGAISNLNASIGSLTGSNGAATVDGANSMWTINAGLSVGDNLGTGLGVLSIQGGGTVSSGVGYIGRVTGAMGGVTVAGADSTWNVGNQLYIGDAGSGTLNITGGGTVANARSYIGHSAGSTGMVIVEGAGSAWNSTEGLSVGLASSTAALTIQNGAAVSSGNISSFDGIGGGIGSSGIVTVTGAGSTWTNAGISVGNGSGTGTLKIQNGATVSSDTFLIIGDNSFTAGIPKSSGIVILEGVGSKWTGGNLTVGSSLNAVATLNISSGALMAASQTIIGSGYGSDGAVTIDGAGSALTNSGDLTIGNNGEGRLTITNGGHVSNTNGYIGRDSNNDDDTVLIASVDGAGSLWTNRGDLSVGNGNRFDSSSPMLVVSNGGTVSIAGVLFVEPQGTVKGNGNIAADVVNAGVVAPGMSPGALHIDGIYLQATAGKLLMELGGTTAGTSYDQLLVSGAVSLSGTLQVSLLGPFAPVAGNTFNIIDGATIAGAFSSLVLPVLSGGLIWNTSQLYTSGVLSVSAGLAGDYNHNSVVDAADYVVYRNTFGEIGTGLTADGNGNGTIDAGDLAVWRAYFGQTAGVGSIVSSNASVPEPTATAMLIILAAAGILSRMCRSMQRVPRIR